MYQSGVRIWRSSLPQLEPKYTVQVCIGDNLDQFNLGIEPSFPV